MLTIDRIGVGDADAGYEARSKYAERVDPNTYYSNNIGNQLPTYFFMLPKENPQDRTILPLAERKSYIS